METKRDIDAIAELRRWEQGCLARITSIKRKLGYGSTAVSEQDLRIWEQKLNDVGSKLLALNQLPVKIDEHGITSSEPAARLGPKRRGAIRSYD
ncbi:hypothetical protein POK33_38385 [Burkholderia cenocepacia]|uniref:hypothetical protein n=1 Tax=Burkholderia cenocepacia TaxID=95486 RepID=UPI0023B8D3AF|nr:hypothetical protein [Burkholderia cenocepacia]MDF0506625.1 hypothetical protein [Burkholderia cenocepacia]